MGYIFYIKVASINSFINKNVEKIFKLEIKFTVRCAEIMYLASLLFIPAYNMHEATRHSPNDVLNEILPRMGIIYFRIYMLIDLSSLLHI